MWLCFCCSLGLLFVSVSSQTRSGSLPAYEADPPPVPYIPMVTGPTRPTQPIIRFGTRNALIREVFLEVKLDRGWVTYGFGTIVTSCKLVTLRNATYDGLPRRIRLGEYDPFTTRNVTNIAVVNNTFEVMTVQCELSLHFTPMQMFVVYSLDGPLNMGIIQNAAGEFRKYIITLPITVNDSDDFIQIEQTPKTNEAIALGKALINHKYVLIGLYAYTEGTTLNFRKIVYNDVRQELLGTL